MKSDLVIKIAIVALLSMVTNKIVYFGYTPNYAADIFSRQAFNGRFDHDVYKYRILSKYLLFEVDDWLGKTMPEKGAEWRIAIQTPGGSQRFYLAFYYLNTFFLVLTSILVVLLLHLDSNFQLSEAERNLIMFLVPVVISLSQFVVCCYDVSSYFFQLLILYIFLKYIDRYRMLTLSIIGALLIISTLNRESSALSVSMIILLLLAKYGINRRTILSCCWLAACFLLTYLGLRYFIRESSNLHIVNIQAGHLLIDTNIIGLFFWALFFYLPLSIANSAENRCLIAVFFLFSLPYILTCLKDGVLWEVRLYVPLFIGSIFLSKLDTAANIIRLTDRRTLRILRRQIQ
jgi:hypothetical protein